MDQNTWDAVTGDLIDRFATTEEQRQSAATALDYDLNRGRFEPDADLLAESNEKWIARLAPHVHGGQEPGFGERVEAVIAELVSSQVMPMEGATSLLRRLSATDVTVALATNDGERSAASQVEQLGWASLIPHVVGYDSGFGPKPEPGMLLGLLDRIGVVPENALMVGDTWADAQAAAAANIHFCLIDPTGRSRNHLDADSVVSSLAELASQLFDNE